MRGNAFKLKRKVRIFIVIFIVCVLIAGSLAYHQFNTNIKVSVERQVRSTIRSVSAQNVELVESQIDSRLTLLSSIAGEIKRTGFTNTEMILKVFKSYAENYGFYDMAVIDKDGIGYTTLGETVDFSGSVSLRDAFNGVSYTKEGFLAEDYDKGLHVFVFPIEIDGSVEMLITASYTTEAFLSLMDVESFDGQARSMLLNKDGKSMASLNKESGVHAGTDYCSMACYISDHRDILPDFADIDANGGQFFNYDYEGKLYVGYCEATSSRSWYLMTYVPSEYIYQSASSINHSILSMLIALYVVIIIISVLFIVVYQRFQRRIKELVFKDRITGNANYQYFKVAFENFTEKDKRNHWLVNFDVDKFKMINLIYGVDFGDRLLGNIFDICRECWPEDLVYRYHADIFVAVLYGEDKFAVIEKIGKALDVFKEQNRLGNLPELSLSFGICGLDEFPQLSLIYSNAVLAKNEVKGSLTTKYKFCDETVKLRVEYRNMEIAFKKAMEKHEFQVWYQPKYDMRTGEICGAEALVRWQKADGSIISPGSFIPVFENTGQIIELDEEVLRIVCRDIKELRDKGIAVKPVSVNLSKLHLIRKGIMDKIQTITEEYNINQSDISFEITESASLDDKETMNRLVARLHERGFRVDMDDYGTGSSTLSSLSDTNFDTLKLDKSFVDKIGNEKMDIIIQSTIHLAKRLNMRIIAEGVEHAEQAQWLVEHECYFAQGYYFSRPVDKFTYFDMLTDWKRL